MTTLLLCLTSYCFGVSGALYYTYATRSERRPESILENAHLYLAMTAMFWLMSLFT
jgi:hypothetical protein